MVYQNPLGAVSHRLSVFDIVAEPLPIQQRSLNVPEIERRVLSALTDVHLPTESAFLKLYTHELNMGAVQRVCIARALIQEPSLLIGDEPTSSLDPSVQAKVAKMLLELQVERGMTMLFVTQDIGLARKIGDRVGVMYAGRLVELGPTAEVFGMPCHPYTRLLLQKGGHSGNLTEATPKETRAGQGCSFASRCGRAVDECVSRAAPEMCTINSRHTVACWFPLNASGTDWARYGGRLQKAKLTGTSQQMGSTESLAREQRRVTFSATASRLRAVKLPIRSALTISRFPKAVVLF